MTEEIEKLRPFIEMTEVRNSYMLGLTVVTLQLGDFYIRYEYDTFTTDEEHLERLKENNIIDLVYGYMELNKPDYWIIKQRLEAQRSTMEQAVQFGTGVSIVGDLITNGNIETNSIDFEEYYLSA